MAFILMLALLIICKFHNFTLAEMDTTSYSNSAKIPDSENSNNNTPLLLHFPTLKNDMQLDTRTHQHSSRLKRGNDHGFIRFGRNSNNDAKNLIRFGRNEGVKSNGFVRLGRSDKSFVRLGRDDGDQSLRFGRRGDNFIRLGRSFGGSTASDDLLRYRLAMFQKPLLSFKKPLENEESRVTRGNFIRLGRRDNSFIRLGKKNDINKNENPGDAVNEMTGHNTDELFDDATPNDSGLELLHDEQNVDRNQSGDSQNKLLNSNIVDMNNDDYL